MSKYKRERIEVFRPDLQIIQIYFALLQKNKCYLKSFLYASKH